MLLLKRYRVQSTQSEKQKKQLANCPGKCIVLQLVFLCVLRDSVAIYFLALQLPVFFGRRVCFIMQDKLSPLWRHALKQLFTLPKKIADEIVFIPQLRQRFT